MSKKYNAIRIFNSEAEAKAFAEKVNSDSWGAQVNMDGTVHNWYVDCNFEDWEE